MYTVNLEKTLLLHEAAAENGLFPVKAAIQVVYFYTRTLASCLVTFLF
jgi:hypothetical protein